MEIHPIAYFRSPLTSKFGIPRQSGIATGLTGRVVLEPDYRRAEAVRGLEHFDYVWLIWEFSANRETTTAERLTVRPPRLGGNERIGVFASRSPFRPNRLGLSCVRLCNIEMEGPEAPALIVEGADLMDHTPIYDIKPYVAYADSRPVARSGFVDEHTWQRLEVCIPEQLAKNFTVEELRALKDVLAEDPRPPFHHDACRIYGMPFAHRDVRFRVGTDGVLRVVEVNDD